MHFDNYAYKGKQQMNYTSALFHSSNLNAFSVCRCFAIKRQMTQKICFMRWRVKTKNEQNYVEVKFICAI